MSYTDEEKAAAIAQYKQGVSAQELSSKYGISQRTVYRWVQLYRQVNPSARKPLTAKEYDMLMCRVMKLENIISILKTVNCTAHAPLKERLCELGLLYGKYMTSTRSERR